MAKLSGRWTALILLAISAALGIIGLRWFGSPAEVADHAAPFVATLELRFAAPTVVGQSFQARWNGLSRIDVILAAEPNEPLPTGHLVFHLRPDIQGTDVLAIDDIRSVQIPVAELMLPRQPVLELRPGQGTEQWTSFRFSPIPNSRLQRYVWLLEYKPNTPGDRLQLLTHFNKRYRNGSLLIDGGFINGNALFRVSFNGRQKDHFWITRDNLLLHTHPGHEPVMGVGLVLLVVLIILLPSLWPRSSVNVQQTKLGQW